MNKLIFVPLALVLLAACDNDPGKDKSKATVGAPVESVQTTTAASATAMATATAAATNGAKYTFSNAGSKVEWTGAKITAKHEGSFETFTGTINLVENDPTKSSVTVDIDTSSLKVEPDKLAGHLKSQDFFDVQKFPKAKFTSTSIKAGGDKGATHTITGNFELHGVTKSISFPATITVAGDDVKVNAEFAINRKDFGLVYPGKPDDLIKDDVAIKLTIDGKKGS